MSSVNNLQDISIIIITQEAPLTAKCISWTSCNIYVSIYIICVKLHYAYENYKEFANIIQDYIHVDYSQYRLHVLNVFGKGSCTSIRYNV